MTIFMWAVAWVQATSAISAAASCPPFAKQYDCGQDADGRVLPLAFKQLDIGYAYEMSARAQEAYYVRPDGKKYATTHSVDGVPRAERTTQTVCDGAGWRMELSDTMFFEDGRYMTAWTRYQIKPGDGRMLIVSEESGIVTPTHQIPHLQTEFHCSPL